MSDEIRIDESLEPEILVEGDVPDEKALAGWTAEATPCEQEEEPFIGTIEDLENGSSVGWSD